MPLQTEAFKTFLQICTHNAEFSALPVEHLQLSQDDVDLMHAMHIWSMGDFASKASEAMPETWFHAIEDVALSARGYDISWYDYWKVRNFALHHLFLICEDLADASAQNGLMYVSRETFGNAGAMLERAGYKTLGQLVLALRSGIRNVRGMGKKKEQQLISDLLAFIEDVRDGKIKLSDLYVPDAATESEPIVSVSKAPIEVSNDLLETSVLALHLGRFEKPVIDAGISTIGSLVEFYNSDRLGDLAISQRAKEHLSQKIEILSGLPESGDIWGAFYSKIGVRLLPATKNLQGNAFIKNILPVLLELIGSYEDPLFKMIFVNRLLPSPFSRMNLNDISEKGNFNISRERVRQKETALIERLVGVLKDGFHGDVNLHLRADFIAKWRQVLCEPMTEAVQKDDLQMKSFILNAVSRIWGVERAEIVDLSPLIANLLVGSAVSGVKFGNTVDVPKILLSIEGDAARMPMTKFNIGRASHALAALEDPVLTLGDFIHGLDTGSIVVRSGSLIEHACSHLSTIAKSMISPSEIDMQAYAKASGMALCIHEGTSARDFLKDVRSDLSSILHMAKPMRRFAAVFFERTSLPAEERPSMDDMAVTFDTTAMTLRCDELEALEFLCTVLKEGDASACRVHLPEDFLSKWKEVFATWDASSEDVALFSSTLAQAWGVHVSEVKEALPSLISVTTGYAFGRSSRSAKKEMIAA